MLAEDKVTSDEHLARACLLGYHMGQWECQVQIAFRAWRDGDTEIERPTSHPRRTFSSGQPEDPSLDLSKVPALLFWPRSWEPLKTYVFTPKP